MSAPLQQKRTEDPHVRRAQILRAAEACFGDTGFHPTTMAQIAARAGLSVGLIYQFFPGKEALIEGIVLADFDDQIAWLEQQPRDVHPDLHALLTRREKFGEAMHLGLEIAAELSRNPALAELLRSKQRTLVDLLVDRVRAALPGGGGPDIEERVRMILALHFGVRMQIAVEGDAGKERLQQLAYGLGRALLTEIDF
jgi:TetR/AcrR family transcriptional repressor of uid operon